SAHGGSTRIGESPSTRSRGSAGSAGNAFGHRTGKTGMVGFLPSGVSGAGSCDVCHRVSVEQSLSETVNYRDGPEGCQRENHEAVLGRYSPPTAMTRPAHRAIIHPEPFMTPIITAFERSPDRGRGLATKKEISPCSSRARLCSTSRAPHGPAAR